MLKRVLKDVFAGFIHKFLSWKFFLPLSRLAYGIYLIHYSYLRAYTSQSRTPIYFSEMYFFTIYLGCLFAIILISAIAFLFVELPFQNIEKLIFANSRSQTPRRNEHNIDAVEGMIYTLNKSGLMKINLLCFFLQMERKRTRRKSKVYSNA